MKTLRLHCFFKKAAAVFLHHEIHTGEVFLARGGRKVPSYTEYEPGEKFRNSMMQNCKNPHEFEEEMEDEGDYGEDVDFMSIDRAYDEDVRETKRRKEKIGQLITKQRFFASRPEPQTLTYQERECIKYLHKQDPVQWNVKILSESFPATTSTISKILKSKWKITPERAKKLDSKVQRNWELLAEGKLVAEPHVLEHLKKFVNRREVLLEQIKKENFYLPEIKQEPVWNQGELNSILIKYEREIKKLHKASNQQEQKMLEDGMSKKERSDKTRSIESLHEKIAKIGPKKQMEGKDSFILGEMINAYARESTLDELESQILQKAEAKKQLGSIEKAILETKLGVPSCKDIENASKSIETKGLQEKMEQKEDRGNRGVMKTDKQLKVKQNEKKVDRDNILRTSRPVEYNWSTKQEEYHEDSITRIDDKTRIADERTVGKLLNEIHKVPQPEEDAPKKKKKAQKEMNLTDSKSLEQENAFYDREVDDIKNTSFWNNPRSSEEKAFSEYHKANNDRLASKSMDINLPSTPVFSIDEYPEKIKIPESMRGSGLTFKIKDCYYDDDGKFLYRVPGMTK